VLYGQNLNKRKVDDKGKVYYDQTYFKDSNGAPLVIDMEVVPGGYGAESQYHRENYSKLKSSKKSKK
jgi:putative intracellular protease/amidase